jgi:hypothetical protein
MDAVRAACTAGDLDSTGIQLLHHYSNAVVLVPAEGAVARVAAGRHDVAQIRHSQQVTRWLVEQHGFPATCPLPGTDVIEVEPSTTVSFWVYYPQPASPPPLTSAHLGCLLTQLHTIPTPPGELPRWVPLVSLDHALHDDTAVTVLDDADRDWLLRRVSEIRNELAAVDWVLGHGLIHGDAWAGNPLRTPAAAHSPDGVVLGDWDRVAHGPREVDLIPTWHAAHRYGKGASWTRDFVHRYGHDLTDWSASRRCSPCATSLRSADRCDAHPTRHPTPARCGSESPDFARATPVLPGRHSDRVGRRCGC